MMSSFPSQAGRKALLNIAAGRRAGFGLYGMSANGGLCGTMLALRRRGLLDAENNLTEEGQQMVGRLTLPPEVKND